MSRIAWSRYNGEEIEHAIAMFVSSEDVWAEKITPSRGDGGVDILSRRPKVTVYQVKSFTCPLTAGQKKKVTDSLEKLVTDARWEHLDVEEWHLVTPWDPTPETEVWLQEEARSRGITNVVWDGLAKCDMWAAKYPQIVDYYFNGLRETVLEAAEALLQRNSLRGLVADNPDVTVTDVGNTLSEAVTALNLIDPHYSYGIATRPKRANFPEIFDEFSAGTSPRPLTSKFQIIGDTEVRIDIFPKTNLSVELRPIEMGVTLWAKKGSPADTAIRDFFTFGTPLNLPEDSADVNVDAPGGLGGTLTGAAISLLPHAGNKATAPALRLVLLDAERSVIDEIPLERDYVSFGTANEGKIPGAETKLVDPMGVLTVVLRSEFQEQKTDINLSIATPQGKLAVEVLPTMQFLANMRKVKSLVVAPRFGKIPYEEAIDSTVIPERLLDQNVNRYELAASIAVIQEHASFGIHFPDLSRTRPEWLREIVRMGNLLKGQTETFSAESIRTHHEPREIEGPTQVCVLYPILIQFPEGVVSIDCEFSFKGILTRSAMETEEGVVDEWEVVDHLMNLRASHLPPEQPK